MCRHTSVLFLHPSISCIFQSRGEWPFQAGLAIKNEEADISVHCPQVELGAPYWPTNWSCWLLQQSCGWEHCWIQIAAHEWSYAQGEVKFQLLFWWTTCILLILVFYFVIYCFVIFSSSLHYRNILLILGNVTKFTKAIVKFFWLQSIKIFMCNRNASVRTREHTKLLLLVINVLLDWIHNTSK